MQRSSLPRCRSTTAEGSEGNAPSIRPSLGFENYELAANVAQFPLPVIVGIGHERDVTILDYVAGVRVKTPTAAAEWLIERGKNELIRAAELPLATACRASRRATATAHSVVPSRQRAQPAMTRLRYQAAKAEDVYDGPKAALTRYNGHAVTDAAEVPAGAVLETMVASGTIVSVKQ